MNKLLKLSTAFILIGCLNHPTYSASPTPSSVAPSVYTAAPVIKMSTAAHSNFNITCDSVISGWAPVAGRPNTYVRSSQSCGGPSTPGFVGYLPAGAKAVTEHVGWVPVPGQPDNNFRLVSYFSGDPVPSGLVDNIPRYARRWVWIPVSGQSNTFQLADYSTARDYVTNLPAGAKVLPMNAPLPVSAASVQWLPAQYYRYPGLDGMIYVDDNNGDAFLQNGYHIKTNLSRVPRGQYLPRPSQYQLPGWLLAKFTQNPSDNDEHFISAGNGNSSNRIISKRSDGVLQVTSTTQNQWTDRHGVVYQVPPANSVSVNSQSTAAQPIASASITANSVSSR